MTTRSLPHAPEQIVRKPGLADRILADSGDVAAVCRELGVAEQTCYRWRNRYGGLRAEDAELLNKLEKHKANLKPPLAEAELEIAELKELAEGDS